ncbi:hypothetical protein D3C84_942690 [compost metagenome]
MIRPPVSSTPSYSFCAACMVRWAVKPSLRAASCCRVEVVKGGEGERLTGFFSIALIVKVPALMASRAAVAMASETMSRRCTRLPSCFTRRVVKGGLSAARSASTDQYSCALNFPISISRSTTMRRATDCTRPAERAPGSLRHSTGERLKPTR